MDCTGQNTTSTSAERYRQYRLRKKRQREEKAVDETQTPQVCELSAKRFKRQEVNNDRRRLYNIPCFNVLSRRLETMEARSADFVLCI
jgi:hypothetical protein